MNCSIDEENIRAERVWTEFKAVLGGMVPEARAAFLLHEVFQLPVSDTARLIGLPPEVCRGHAKFVWMRAASHMLGLGLTGRSAR